MKNVLLTLCTLFNLTLFAQHTSGTIEYKEVFVMADSIKERMKELPEEVFKALTKKQELFNVLYFDEDEMLYRNLVKEDTSREFQDPNAFVFNMNRSRPDYIRYTDLETGVVTESKDFFGRQFLITNEKPTPQKWKVTTEIQLIAGYPCQKASCETEEGLIFVWFTPKIAAKVGPKDLYGLQGAVLQVEYKRVNRVITADKIELNTPDASLFEKPRKGKKVTYEEFQKIQEEKIQEMRERGGAHMIPQD